MSADRRRIDLRVAPLAIVAIVLAMGACAVVSAKRLDNIYLFYAVAGFGIAAGLFQWRSRRELAANPESGARNTLMTQIYGMFILTAVCAVPAILIGRAVAGVSLLTGT